MKKSEIAMIILIASVSILIAYFIANAIFGGKSTQTEMVKTIDPINSNITSPDPAIFNSNAINPSVQVQINNTTTN